MRHLLLVIILFPAGLWCQTLDSNSKLDQYSWIGELYPNCEGLEFEEYDNGAFAYIYVSEGTLYFQDGSYYCGDGVNRDCRQLYGLQSADISDTFTCGDGSLPEEENEAQSIELFIDSSFVSVGDEFCVDLRTNAIHDLLSFQFQVQLSNENLEINEAVSASIADVFTLIEGDIVKFLWFSEELLPIQVEDDTSIATLCFTVIDAIDNQSDIGLLNTDRLFAQFITADSTGDFFENTDVSLSGGSIQIEASEEDTTADEALKGIPVMAYPWMADVIANHGCEGTRVTEYDFGSYSFFYFSSSLLSQVYNEDGRFYCQDTPTRDCKAFYQLNPEYIVNQWICEE